MEASSTALIVIALSRAIIEHRLLPGSELAAQLMATHLAHVQANLALERSVARNNIAMALN